MSIERTPIQILARIEAIRPADDFFGAERGDLICALPWESAKPFLSAVGVAAGEAKWEAETRCTDPAAAIRDYLPFAFGKARDERGLSAQRSVDHLRAWMWLLGDDAFGSISWGSYAPYGLPILQQVAAHVGFTEDGDS